jgi:paraquat-inducible protein B
MKKIILSVFSFLFLFTMAIPALAVQGTPSAASTKTVTRNEATQGAVTGERETVRQEIGENIQEKMATVQARLTEGKKEIIRNHFNRVVRRLTAAINRFYLLIDRIESRLAKIEQQDTGIDTVLIKKDISSAKEKLGQIAVQLESLKTEMNQVIESETPKDSFTQIKESVAEIREILIEIHQMLVKVIGDIRGLRVGNTSTPSALTE